MKKKYKKAINSKYDPVRIIFGNLYSKHQTKISNYNIAKINSILFTYGIPDATQIIDALYKEMVILCDSNEYLKNNYSHEDSSEKLQLLGYIYTYNFRPPPNYISLDKFNSNIMFKLLNHKQELIDRYNYYMLKKQQDLNNESGKDYDDHFMDLKPLYDSSDYKKTNNDNKLSKKSSSKNKPNINLRNLKGKLKKNVHFSKDTFNLKSYISFINEESKFESKGVSKYMESIEIKENEEENNENSMESIMKIMENFKKNIVDNNKNILIVKNNYNANKVNNNNKDNTDIIKMKKRFSKRLLTGEILINQNIIIDLLKKYRHNFTKSNKYYLSIDQFKEKLKENNKMKDHLEKYWKTNKKFVTNLIENKNINLKNKILFPNFSPRFDYTSEDTLSKKFNTNFYNILSLSNKSKLSSISYNSRMPSISPRPNRHIFFKKHTLNLNLNKNKLINSVGNKRTKNSLIMKIKNNSDFMKNKKFFCVISSETKDTNTRSTEKNLILKRNNINKENKKKIIPFFPLNIIRDHSRNNFNFRRKCTYNLSKKYDYFGNSSFQNENNFFKSFQ